jgi:hypothetical protein
LVDQINEEIRDLDLEAPERKPDKFNKVVISPLSSQLSRSSKTGPLDSAMNFVMSNDVGSVDTDKYLLDPRMQENSPVFLLQPDPNHSSTLRELLSARSPRPNLKVFQSNSCFFKSLGVFDQTQRKAPSPNDDSTQTTEAPSDLSSIVSIEDSSLLKFLLFCKYVGITKSIESILGEFAQHIFIVLKGDQAAVGSQ